MVQYRKRAVDSQVAQLVSAMGAVVIEGPKACGKTMTAMQVARSVVRLDVDANARTAAALDPSLVLEGDTPRLIDEWQIEPAIWNHVRRLVDDRQANGQFLLTGSSVPADDATRHTGAGRIARLRMRPMSLYESGHSTGRVSLAGLMAGQRSRSTDPGLDVQEIAKRVAVGGWPRFVDAPVDHALTAMRAYVDEVRRTDVQRVGGVNHEPDRVLQLMRSIARNVGTMTGIKTLARDLSGPDEAIDHKAAYAYYEALERLMVIEDQPAWAPHLRSKARVRVSPKRHFVDPALAVAVLRATPERLLEDLNLLGFLFESLVIRDLRIYAQTMDAQVLHYKDNTDLEVDAIIESLDGRWGAVEVKLGPGMVDQGAETLLAFSRKVHTEKCGLPRFLAVITGFGLGYVRPDGVHVIPIGALGP
jgi:predicted AAA+ superfamily ATPase